MMEPLVETWEIHNRINLYLLTAIKPEDLKVQVTPRGRSVGDLFAHIHNVRLMWLKSAAPELLTGLEKVEAGSTIAKGHLEEVLAASGAAIAELVRTSAAAGGRVKGFKPHLTAFVGYLISHESHHRGQAVLGLRNAGLPIDKKTSYGLWEWGVR